MANGLNRIDIQFRVRVKNRPQPGHSFGHLGNRLLMRLQRYRLQSKTFGINIKILICNEKERILTRGSQFSQARKQHGFFLHQYILETNQEIIDKMSSSIFADIVSFCIQ